MLYYVILHNAIHAQPDSVAVAHFDCVLHYKFDWSFVYFVWSACFEI